MAELPDPTSDLTPEERVMFERMAAARSHAEGRPELGEVYVRMFNHPEVAVAVGALGELLRFRGVLPDDVRELAILRFASRRRFGYEWAHHQRPARLAGLDEATVAAITAGDAPAALPDSSQAVLEAVDAVVAAAIDPGRGATARRRRVRQPRNGRGRGAVRALRPDGRHGDRVRHPDRRRSAGAAVLRQCTVTSAKIGG